MKVYFDGIEQEQDDAMADWTKTSKLTIPPQTQVLAIECKDFGAQEGILASTEDGMVTDSDWRCSDQRVDGWTLPDFDPPEELFRPPKLIGRNGVKPWNIRYSFITKCLLSFFFTFIHRDKQQSQT